MFGFRLSTVNDDHSVINQRYAATNLTFTVLKPGHTEYDGKLR